jgi:hypothetical protein
MNPRRHRVRVEIPWSRNDGGNPGANIVTFDDRRMSNFDSLNVRYRIEFTCRKYAYDEPDVAGDPAPLKLPPLTSRRWNSGMQLCFFVASAYSLSSHTIGVSLPRQLSDPNAS